MKEGEHLTVPDFDDIYADSEVVTCTNEGCVTVLQIPLLYQSLPCMYIKD